MKSISTIEERAKIFGRYMVDNNATVRQMEKTFNVSKSTIHKDIYERLRRADPFLYEQTRDVIERNKKERHLRGGMATQLKFEKLKSKL